MNESAGNGVISILEDLVRIESVNPAFGTGGAGEAGVAEYLERRWKEAGLRVSRQSALPGRDNVIAELRVGKPERALLFEAHMDTVALGGMDRPLQPITREGRLYGRGACDTKASLAAMTYAMEYWSARRSEMPGDLILCAAVDEEAQYRGVLSYLEHGGRAAGAVVGEPTSLRIVTATKGCSRFRIRSLGRAAHSSVPEEGDNAIYRMADVIAYIRDRVAPSLARSSHPLCGSPTVSVGTVRGGTQINIVAESCEIEVDRRIIPGERPEEAYEALVDGLRRHLGRSFERLRFEPLLSDWALDTDPDAAVVRCAIEVARLSGVAADPIGVPYGSDASKLQQLGGIPSIVFGPGSIAQAHTREEWVDIGETVAAASFYSRLAGEFGKRCNEGGE